MDGSELQSPVLRVAPGTRVKSLNGKNGHSMVAVDVAVEIESVSDETLTSVVVEEPIPVPALRRVDEVVNGMRATTPVQRDGQLIERCLAGDVSAWSDIYREFHESLLVSIRRYLNRAGQDANLVEEIAARVWYSLIKNSFELLAKFDVSRGCRLSTYLSVVAKNETRVLFRSERRRRSREQLASKPDVSDQGLIETHQLVTDEEFLMTLSQAEKAYFLDVLVATPTDREAAEQNYSTENNWQLRHRIRKKLEQYISEADA